MKHKLLLFLILLQLPLWVTSQTQQGYVKTKGRLVDGKLVPGQGIKGATVTVQGRNAVLVNADDGSFSFPMPGKTFQLQEVKKSGYQLVDADIIRRSYTYSPTPLYIVMETPDQQLNDQLAAERKIRRTMQRKLEEREDEIEALKVQQKITEDEYRSALQKLYSEMEGNERLIADMAKQYASMDYDQMDELNRRISDAIINGRLIEADSLLHSKGDLNDRIAEVQREQQAEALRQEKLESAMADLEAAKKGTQKKLDDIADDCKRFFDRFKMDLLFDSAAYYIELRANLDTLMPVWQTDAAFFLQNQNKFNKAETYYERAILIYEYLEEEYPTEYEAVLAQTLNSIGILYSLTQRPVESEAAYQESLSIFKKLAENDPKYENRVSMLLHNLGILYNSNQLFDESETMLLKALEIERRLAAADPKNHEPDLANALNSLGSLYSDIQRFKECETMFNEALTISRRLALDDPQTYEPNVAMILNNLATIYSNSQRFNESEALFLEALEIRRRLAKDNPQAYEPDYATSLSNLASLYEDLQRHAESETLFLESLEIRRRLAKENPQAYEAELTGTLNNLAILYSNIQRFDESEAFYLETLELRRRLAKDKPLMYNPNLATVLHNLAGLYYTTDNFEESEKLFLEALEIRRSLAEENPLAYEPDLMSTLCDLGSLYADIPLKEESEALYKEALDIGRRLVQENPKVYEPELAKTLNNLALLYAEYEQLNECEPILVESIDICRRLVKDNPTVYEDSYFRALLGLSLIYLDQENYEKSYQIEKELLPIFEKRCADEENYQSDHSNLVTNLSFNALLSGHFSEAEQYARSQHNLDPTNPTPIVALAEALLMQGKYDEAEPYFLKMKDERKDSFLNDLETLEEEGLVPQEREDDIKRIRLLLEK